jgi:uncharacterized NAD-dependent epimerase/dehydratase family protein
MQKNGARLKELQQMTGKGIRVAIIDDGIALGYPGMGGVAGGVQIGLNPDGVLSFGKDFNCSQAWSHGTMCAAVIRQRVPDVQLYSIKILNCWQWGRTSGHNGHPLALVAALQWVIEHEMDVVNISLGTISQRYAQELHDQCMAATKAGIPLVGAVHAGGLQSYPSCFDEVIAVGKDDLYADYEYGYNPGHSAEFLAAGSGTFVVDGASRPLREAGVGSNMNYDCNSIAAARMTANIAALLEIAPKLDLAEVRARLIAGQTNPKARYRSKTPSRPNPESQSGHGIPQSLGRTAIYPYNRSTEPVFAHRDLFPFQIECVVDYMPASTQARDAGVLYGWGEVGIPVLARLENVPPSIDSLIIGDLRALAQAERNNLFAEALEWAVRHGKNIFSFDPVEPHIYSHLYAEARQKHLRISSAADSLPDLSLNNPLWYKSKIDVPVVGVVGTSFNQGKFTVQLALRRWLSKEGYQVASVGPNPVCALFDGGVHISQDRRSSCSFPLDEQIAYFGLAIAAAAAAKPHIIVVGSQGGVIPPRSYSSAMSKKQNSHWPVEGTLPSLAMLIASRPDALVLTINSLDQMDFVRRTIQTVENLCQRPVIALAMADKLVADWSYGYNQEWGKTLNAGELSEILHKFNAELKLPVFCPYILNQQRELANFVIESFAASEP